MSNRLFYILIFFIMLSSTLKLIEPKTFDKKKLSDTKRSKTVFWYLL